MNRPASRPARQAGQVAAHKLCAPTAFAGAVRRDALLERLLARDAPPVVLFQGPAGHGKSTLLQQTQSAFASRGALTGWLTFDEADNDVTRFFAHMEAVVEQVARPTGHSSSIAGTNRSGRALRADWFINRLVAVGRPVALFFDEFQTLTSASIHTFFTNLCDAVPAEIRLYLGSRALPDLGLTRLEVNNRALILRPEDLCFSPAEAERFFASATGLEISADELRAMYERTEGWPAALQLYRLALGRPEVRESLHSLVGHRPQQLADYLADNVLALQPPEVQGFLLSTSILARLSAPLCDAVLGQADARDMLTNLEAAGLFLRSVDAEGQWYKYHGLFSSFLADQLQERDPKAATRIHQKAATWFFSRGMHAEAIYHAVAEGNHDLAAEILDQWATGLIRDAHLVTVERWHDRIPAAALENHPDLVTKAAYACIFLRRHDKLRPLLAVLEALPASSRKCMVTSPEVVRSMAAVVADDLAGAARIVAGVDVHDPETGEFRAFELGAAANLKGLLAIAAGELESAREWLALARAQSERGHAPFSWGYAVGMAATNLLVQGHTDQALAMFREGMDEPGISVDESFASAAVVSCYIRALYDSDQLDLAAEQFQQFHDVIQQAALLDQLAVAYLSMARIHDARGDAAAADKVLDEAEAVGYAGRWP
ncbi:MAG: AAA family ATPase, partial [Salinisphaera sp.]|nr:AAA family ATPase [Salinisphaera sp.]